MQQKCLPGEASPLSNISKAEFMLYVAHHHAQAFLVKI